MPEGGTPYPRPPIRSLAGVRRTRVGRGTRRGRDPGAEVQPGRGREARPGALPGADHGLRRLPHAGLVLRRARSGACAERERDGLARPVGRSLRGEPHPGSRHRPRLLDCRRAGQDAPHRRSPRRDANRAAYADPEHHANDAGGRGGGRGLPDESQADQAPGARGVAAGRRAHGGGAGLPAALGVGRAQAAARRPGGREAVAPEAPKQALDLVLSTAESSRYWSDRATLQRDFAMRTRSIFLPGLVALAVTTLIPSPAAAARSTHARAPAVRAEQTLLDTTALGVPYVTQVTFGSPACDSCPPRVCPGDPLLVTVSGLLSDGCQQCVHLTGLGADPDRGLLASVDWRPNCVEFACLPETLSHALGVFAAGSFRLTVVTDVHVLREAGADTTISYPTAVVFDVSRLCDSTVTGCLHSPLPPYGFPIPECSVRVAPGGRGDALLPARNDLHGLGVAGVEGFVSVFGPFRIVDIQYAGAAAGVHVSWRQDGNVAGFLVFRSAPDVVATR